MPYTRWKRVFHLLPVLSLLLLCGCWSRVEINDRAFVAGMYVDLTEDGLYEVSLGFPLPNRMTSAGSTSYSSGAAGNPYALVSKKGESIPMAIRKIRSDLSREISWGHCRIIVLGRKLAESGIDPVLEYLAREPNFHTKSYIMVAPDKGKDVSNLTPVFERLPAEVLREFARRNVTLDTSVKDFLEAQGTGGDMLSALLTENDGGMLSEKGAKGIWIGTDGAAVFKQGKMIGTFDVKEMRAALWIQGKMRNSMISLKSPSDGKTISFLILNSTCSIKPFVENGKIRIRIRIEAEDDIISSESDLNLTDPHVIDQLEDLLSEQLDGRIRHAIEKTQEMGVDALGFGRYVDWYYPNVWDKVKGEWRQEYKNVTFDINAHIAVKRSGLEKNPILRQYHDEGG